MKVKQKRNEFGLNYILNLTFVDNNVYNIIINGYLIHSSSQCSTTGVTKTVVCAILSVGWCI